MRCFPPILFVAVVSLAWIAARAPDAPAADAEVAALVRILDANARKPFAQRERAQAIRDLGRIGGAEAAAALLPLFDDPFVHLRDHAVSAWIAMLKGEAASETLHWIQRRAAPHRDPEVRRGAAVALGLAAPGGALDVVATRLGREKQAEVLAALLEAHGRLKGGIPPGAAAFVTHRDGRVALALADALLAQRLAGDLPLTVRELALSHGAPRAQAAGILLAQAAGGLPPDRVSWVQSLHDEIPRMALADTMADDVPSLPWDTSGRATLRALLEDPSWRVRAAAIDAALSRWRADVVPLLIERLRAEEGRLRLDAWEALRVLTGQDVGLDAELWAAWWRANATSFDPGPHPRRGRGPLRRGARAAHPDETHTAAFFRLPVLSTRVAFLFDCSGSMRDPAVGDHGASLTKMDLARREFARTLEALGPSTSFDVFLYRYPSEYPPRAEMTRALGKLSPCTPAKVRAARAWLARQEGRGWGAFSDALEALAQEEIDTIFFLSDGRPSRGRYDRDFRLLQEFTRANRFRRVVVHTVLVGTEGANRRFLQDLAALAGGRFRDATRPPRGNA
ncbi:MAG: vWA domain-containing protein [Planctomycetota bacterium]